MTTTQPSPRPSHPAAGAGVADSPDDLTPEWVGAALGAEVAGVTAERFGSGQIGTCYRLAITYAPGSEGPARLVAKMAGGDPEARGAVSDGFRKEVGFYTDLAPTVDVRVPRCWYAAIADDASAFTLLLEDMAPAVAGVQADGCTVEQAAAAVANIAGLHAPRWSDESLYDLPFTARVDRTVADFLGMLQIQATEQFTARYAGELDPADVETLRAAAAATGAWLCTRQEPFAPSHGDHRLDNLLFHPDGWVATVDWQTASVAPPLRDVAYFLGNSLPTDARRAEEEALVAGYHAELVRRGVTGYPADDCFVDYRLGQLQGPLVTVLGSEMATAVRTPEADRMFCTMAARACAAIRDLASLDLVDR